MQVFFLSNTKAVGPHMGFNKNHRLTGEVGRASHSQKPPMEKETVKGRRREEKKTANKTSSKQKTKDCHLETEVVAVGSIVWELESAP